MMFGGVSLILLFWSVGLAIIEGLLFIPDIVDGMSVFNNKKTEKLYKLLYKHIIVVAIFIINILLIMIFGDPYSNFIKFPFVILSIIWFLYALILEDRK